MSSAIDSVKLASFTSPQQAVEVLKEMVVAEKRALKYFQERSVPSKYEKEQNMYNENINALGVALLAFTSVEVLRAENTALREKQEKLKEWLEKEIEINKLNITKAESLFKLGKGREVNLVRYDKDIGKRELFEVLKEVLGEL